MEELVFFAGLVLLMSLVILPICVWVLFKRSQDAHQAIADLKRTVSDLQLKLEDAPLPPELAESQAPAIQHADIIAPQPHIMKPDNIQVALPDAPVSPWEAVIAPPARPVISEQPAPVKNVQKTAKVPLSSRFEERKKDLMSGFIHWFMQGNPLAKVGILLLFLGLAYLLKYSVEQDMFPIELRLIGAAAGCVVLLWLGWRLRLKQPVYALILQGGAVGALYITVFGAFRIYHLLPHLLAFGLMLVICAASIGLAVLQRTLSLAMLASLGGYLSPLLLSSGSGNYIGLFSYYLLLSIGILIISIWQPWRPLNLLGFFFTFGVASLWGMDNYQPAYYLYCQLFLIANIVIFGVLCLALSLRAQPAGHKIIDGTLLFGPPLIGFAMQYLITLQWEFGPAFSALGFGLVYLILAWLALKKYPQSGQQLVVASLALGGVFATLAIPLALSAQWTSLAWALEGLGILWLGQRQTQTRMSLSGSALLLLALASALVALSDAAMGTLSYTLVFGILALTWLAGAFLWSTSSIIPQGKLLSRVLLTGGIALWLACLAGMALRLAIDDNTAMFLTFGLLIASAGLWRYSAQRLAWSDLTYAPWLLWPIMWLTLAAQILGNEGLFSAGWLNIVWLAAIAMAVYFLKNDAQSLADRWLIQGLHLTLFWTVLLGIVYEVFWQTQHLPWGMIEWQLGLQMLTLAILMLATLAAVRRHYWPFAAYPQLYAAIGLSPLAALALLLLILSNTLDGVVANSLYLPLLNPLEEGAGFAILALITFALNLLRLYPQSAANSKQYLLITLAALLFWWGNGIILRALAYYGDIAWRGDALWASRLVQTTLVLVWMLLALIIMIWSTRQHQRKAWFTGAALLGLVIVKLILVDSARGGGLARAVAFIGVAILVLIVGYFSPLPPKSAEQKTPKITNRKEDV